MKTQTHCEICNTEKYLVQYQNAWVCLQCRAKLMRLNPLTALEIRACEAIRHLRGLREEEGESTEC